MDKLLDILKSIGFPYAYDHFAEGEAPGRTDKEMEGAGNVCEEE